MLGGSLLLTDNSLTNEQKNVMKVLIWNKKENRPATPIEINYLMNGDKNGNDIQFAQSWDASPKYENCGIVDIFIDSGLSDDYDIRSAF